MKMSKSFFALLLVLTLLCAQASALQLKKGQQGLYPLFLQERLQQLGYDVGEPSGTYDTKTADAVKAFQKANDIKASGAVNDATWEALFSETTRLSCSVSSGTDLRVYSIHYDMPAPFGTMTRRKNSSHMDAEVVLTAGGIEAVASLTAFSSMAELPFLLFADRLYERFGAGKLMCVSALCMALRWTLLAAFPSVPVAMASQLLHGGGFIVMTVSMAKHMNATVPPELKSSGQMLIAVVGFGIARAFGILGGGLVASAMGSIQMGFALMAGISGVALIAFAPKYLRMKPLNGGRD